MIRFMQLHPVGLKILAFILFAFAYGETLFSQIFPQLRSMDNNDPLFTQLGDDIQSFYLWQAGNGLAPQLSFYSYIVENGDSLFSLAARLNLPQSSIATINRLDRPQLPEQGTEIIIPNIPGIFIPAEPISDFERILARRIHEDGSIELSEKIFLPSRNGPAQAWNFIVASDFTGIERRAFLQVFFRDPLPSARLSSRYGIRISPFTGKSQFHFGIDLAAPAGTAVHSSSEGTIVDAGYDNIYGYHISIQHPGGYRSLYAHLESSDMEIGTPVRSGEKIATVGNSGLTTGTHLHLEIFYLGKNRDPQLYMRHNER